jgi:sugar lactone lactonase YvrE
MRPTPHLAFSVGAELGEGLTLFPDGGMYWVDLLAGLVYRLDGEHNHRVGSHPTEVSKVLPWNRGAILLTRSGLLFHDSTQETLGTLDLTSGDSALRCSDGAVLPDGSLVVGIMDRNMAPHAGRFVHINHRGEIHSVVEKTSVSNGVAVLASEKNIVWTDSATARIMVLDIDPATGIPHSPRTLCEVPPDWGVPDGLATDASGGVWIALWGGGAVRRVDARGALTHTIEIPVPHVTSLAFDADNNLWISTATVVLSPEQRKSLPGAGGLWRIDNHQLPFTGLPVYVATLNPPQISAGGVATAHGSPPG